MPDNKPNIHYPRRLVIRGILRAAGRVILPFGFKLSITGEQNFPQGGPLLVVGNHVAVMEAVMMTLLTPWQVEMIGSIDLPHEKLSEVAMRLWGSIPFRRGHMERQSMLQALDVLAQGGILGLFPEGGVWDVGSMRAQTGISWLSYRSGAPVLPIGFSGTLGALDKALRLKRPKLEMNVGRLIPAADLPDGMVRKLYFQVYAQKVVETVNGLLPDNQKTKSDIKDERFELQTALYNQDGVKIDIPHELVISQRFALSKLLHRPVILKIFRQNLSLPVAPLQNLDLHHSPVEITRACEAILCYLEEENPYFLAYRFGPRQAEEMKIGVAELNRFSSWAGEAGYSLKVTPIRIYYLESDQKEVIQTIQDAYQRWR